MNFGFLQEHKTFEGFEDNKRLLDRSQYFKMIKRKKNQLCYLKFGKNHLIVELLYQRK